MDSSKDSRPLEDPMEEKDPETHPQQEEESGAQQSQQVEETGARSQQVEEPGARSQQVEEARTQSKQVKEINSQSACEEASESQSPQETEPEKQVSCEEQSESQFPQEEKFKTRSPCEEKQESQSLPSNKSSSTQTVRMRTNLANNPGAYDPITKQINSGEQQRRQPNIVQRACTFIRTNLFRIVSTGFHIVNVAIVILIFVRSFCMSVLYIVGQIILLQFVIFMYIYFTRLRSVNNASSDQSQMRHTLGRTLSRESLNILMPRFFRYFQSLASLTESHSMRNVNERHVSFHTQPLHIDVTPPLFSSIRDISRTGTASHIIEEPLSFSVSNAESSLSNVEIVSFNDVETSSPSSNDTETEYLSLNNAEDINSNISVHDATVLVDIGSLSHIDAVSSLSHAEVASLSATDFQSVSASILNDDPNEFNNEESNGDE